MKIKKGLLFILGFILTATIACDKIDQTRENNTRGIVVSANIVRFGSDTLVITEDPASADKHVLLEDYTGHLCGTCPPAGLVLDTLRLIYGEKLVAIGVHSGVYSEVCPSALECPSSAPAGSFTTSFKNDASVGWASLFGINAYPTGMINRMGFPTSHKKSYTTWRTAVQNELFLPSVAKINIAAKYDANDGLVKTGVKADIIDASNSDSLALQIILIEDNIIDWQQWYGHSPQYVPDYVHRDVLRAAFNSINGENFIPNFSSAMTVCYSLKLDSKWNPANCRVVAFLYKKSNYSVVQVAEAKLQ